MKKILISLLAVILLVGCGNKNTSNTESEEAQQVEQEPGANYKVRRTYVYIQEDAERTMRIESIIYADEESLDAEVKAMEIRYIVYNSNDEVMETSYKQVAKYLQSVVEDPSQIESKQTEENGVGSISAFYETA